MVLLMTENPKLPGCVQRPVEWKIGKTDLSAEARRCRRGDRQNAKPDAGICRAYGAPPRFQHYPGL